MDIRPAEPDDLPELLRVGEIFHASTSYATSIPMDKASFAATLRALAAMDHGLLLVATDDENRAVGMVAVVTLAHWFNANYTIAQEVFWWVDDSQHGTNTGALLTATVERWAYEKGCVTLSRSSATNPLPAVLKLLYALPDQLH